MWYVLMMQLYSDTLSLLQVCLTVMQKNLLTLTLIQVETGETGIGLTLMQGYVDFSALRVVRLLHVQL